MHQDHDQMEEINLLDLYQEEIDYLEHQNQSLQKSEDPIDQRQYWKNEIVIEYFKNRINLTRVFILIDARRGLKNSDHELMDLLNIVAVNFQCILTKIDKIHECLNLILNINGNSLKE